MKAHFNDIKTMSQFLETIKTLSTMVEQMADSALITDAKGIIQYVNPAFESKNGYSKKEVIGKTPGILRSNFQDNAFYKNLWKTILSGKVFRAMMINKKKNGEIYYADQTISPVRDENNHITHFVAVCKDISDRVITEKKLAETNKQLDMERSKLEQILTIEERMVQIVSLKELANFVVKKTSFVLEAEKCSLFLVDTQKGELTLSGCLGLDKKHAQECILKIGEPIAGMIAKTGSPVLAKNIENDPQFKRKMRKSYRTKSFISVPIRLKDEIIGVINVADKKRGLSEEFTQLDLKILMMIARQAAVSIENTELYRKLNYMTITDPITNMYNYRYFIKSLDYEIRRQKRHHSPLCLLMIDIDNFKSYNDTFGHLAGDTLLRKIQKSLVDSLRAIDIACRYAGDEFVIILPETPANGATIVAEKIMKNINRLKTRKKITVSIGISEFHSNLTRYELILKTDTALYKAKKSGKNKIYTYT